MSLESNQMEQELLQAEDGGGSAKQERARKIDSKSKSISRKSFYSNVARKLYFEAAAEEEEEIEVPSTARIGLALESSLQLLATSEGTHNKGSKKRAAKALSMGLVGASPRSPSTLSRLQKRAKAAEDQFGLQGGSPFATPHYGYGAGSSSSKKRSLDQVVVEEEDEEGSLVDAFSRRGRGREIEGNLGTSGLLGSFYGPSAKE